uniref:Large ribosomal subunit protein uL18c n=1 Tax=Cryptomonas curvata TaxID=233186 RepID=A0A222AHF7_9CRYP|nr:ribosomal protein L18 [Cryptomonas curvata]ASO75826.1 ribosomal protein L18 [Cryptomonas curvata]
MSNQSIDKVKRRIRQKVKGTAEKPRLSVFRSNNHIYAQLIDDVLETILSSSTLEVSVSSKLESTSTCEASTLVGQYIAKRSLEANITNVVFDRGGRIYHGRIKALADAAREEGLKF